MDSFFGIGMFELIMIAVIALLVMGPERLPGAMREIAKYMRQLRNISNEFQSQFSEELKLLDEINPKRILNEALDPNAATPAKPLGAKPAPVTPKPGTPLPSKPAPKPLGPTAAGGNSTAAGGNSIAAGGNSILPPALAGAAVQTSLSQPGAGGPSGNGATIGDETTTPLPSQPEAAAGASSAASRAPAAVAPEAPALAGDPALTVAEEAPR